MHVYIIYAHPSRKSFSRSLLEAFTRGLDEAGHTYDIHDLYAEDFRSEMDESEYLRETGLDPDAPVPDDVKAEQEKVARADALAFVFPLWWSDCPAKLKGWFDRVWTYGYAYFYNENEERFTQIDIEKTLILCSAGHTAAHLEDTGVAEAMRRILIQDRLLGIGVNHAELVLLGGMMPGDNTHRDENLQTAYQKGREF